MLGHGWLALAGVVVDVVPECVAAAWETAMPMPKAKPNDPAATPIAASGFLIELNFRPPLLRLRCDGRQSRRQDLEPAGSSLTGVK